MGELVSHLTLELDEASLQRVSHIPPIARVARRVMIPFRGMQALGFRDSACPLKGLDLE